MEVGVGPGEEGVGKAMVGTRKLPSFASVPISRSGRFFLSPSSVAGLAGGSRLAYPG